MLNILKRSTAPDPAARADLIALYFTSAGELRAIDSEGQPVTLFRNVPAGGTLGQVLIKLSSADYVAGWATPNAATVGINSSDDVDEGIENLYFTTARAQAAIEASNAAMGSFLLDDLPTTLPAGNENKAVIAKRSSTDPRRYVLIWDGTRFQFENGSAVIGVSQGDPVPLVMTSTMQPFANGVAVIPSKLIGPRREFTLDFDMLFGSANAANTVQVDVNGTLIYTPTGASTNRRVRHECRLFFNGDGTGFRVGGHLSGNGLGSTSGSGLTSVFPYTAGTDLTLTISGVGVNPEAAQLWRWRLMGWC